MRLSFSILIFLAWICACASHNKHSEPSGDDFAGALQRENTLFAQASAPLQREKWRLFARLQELLPAAPVSDAIRIGNYEYFSRLMRGDVHDRILRRNPNRTDQEEAVLDPNRALAERSGWALASFRPSPSHDRVGAIILDPLKGEKLAAWSTVGSDRLVLLPGYDADQIEWLGDNRTLLIVSRQDLRAAKLLAWDTDSTEPPKLVLAESRPSYYLTIQRSRSGRYIFGSSASLDQEELFWLRCDGPDLLVNQISGAHAPKQSWLSESGDQVVAVDATQIAAPGQSVIAFDSFRDFNLALASAADAKLAILLSRDLKPLTSWRFPPWAWLSAKPNYDFNAASVELWYQDPATPRRSFTLPPGAGALEELSRSVSDASFSSAHSNDGTQVPLAVLWATPQHATAPTLLMGYGAYGELLNTRYSALWKLLLEKGVNVSLCFARGGGEGGRTWYEAGRAASKLNSFHDFIACAEELYRSGVAAPSKLAVYGRSAGGLLAAGSVVMRPELFSALVLDAPLLDVSRQSADQSSSHYQRELAEWGGPSAAEYIARYSPLGNVRKAHYPPLLVLHSLADEQVPIESSLEFVQKIRANSTAEGLALLRSGITGSHASKLDKFVELDDQSTLAAFLLDWFS